jgi:hypothetical protein
MSAQPAAVSGKPVPAGALFEPIFDKHCQSIGAIAIDQAHPDTIWAGTGESNMRNSVSIGNGIYRSTDAGKNWIRMGLEKTEHISKVLLHPNNPNLIFVAAPGPLWSDSPERGLFRSNDGGKTWEKALYINEKTGCADLLIDPVNPDIMYATTWEFRRTPYSFNSGGPGSAIYKSTDGGKNWRKLNKGLPEGDFGGWLLPWLPVPRRTCWRSSNLPALASIFPPMAAKTGNSKAPPGTSAADLFILVPWWWTLLIPSGCIVRPILFLSVLMGDTLSRNHSILAVVSIRITMLCGSIRRILPSFSWVPMAVSISAMTKAIAGIFSATCLSDNSIT